MLQSHQGGARKQRSHCFPWLTACAQMETLGRTATFRKCLAERGLPLQSAAASLAPARSRRHDNSPRRAGRDVADGRRERTTRSAPGASSLRGVGLDFSESPGPKSRVRPPLRATILSTSLLHLLEVAPASVRRIGAALARLDPVSSAKERAGVWEWPPSHPRVRQEANAPREERALREPLARRRCRVHGGRRHEYAPGSRRGS